LDAWLQSFRFGHFSFTHFISMTAYPATALRCQKKIRRESSRFSRRWLADFISSQTHLLRTLSDRKNSVSVNATSLASPLSAAPEPSGSEPALPLAEESPAVPGAIG
jgi:hypothetical protein